MNHSCSPFRRLFTFKSRWHFKYRLTRGNKLRHCLDKKYTLGLLNLCVLQYTNFQILWYGNFSKLSIRNVVEGLERTFPLCKITTSIFPTMQDFDAYPVCSKRNKNPIKFSFFPTMKVWKGIPHYVRLQPASSPLRKMLMLSDYVGKAAKI